MNNQNKPLISILIPCYNISAHKHFVLKNLVKKPLENCEIILLNDYSKDNTLEILKQYESKYQSIKVLDLKDYSEHRGIGFNRDFLIKQANGQYFMFLDADDVVNKNIIRLFIEANENNYDIVACDYKMIFVDKGISVRIPKYPKYKDMEINNAKEFYLKSNSFVWAKMIKKSYWEQTALKFDLQFDGAVYEDIRIFYALMLNNPTFKFIKKPLYHYMVRKNSTSTSIVKSMTIMSNLFDAYKYTLKQIKYYELLNENDYKIITSRFYCQIKCMLIGLSLIVKKDDWDAYQQNAKILLNNFKDFYQVEEPQDMAFITRITYDRATRVFQKDLPYYWNQKRK